MRATELLTARQNRLSNATFVRRPLTRQECILLFRFFWESQMPGSHRLRRTARHSSWRSPLRNRRSFQSRARLASPKEFPRDPGLSDFSAFTSCLSDFDLAFIGFYRILSDSSGERPLWNRRSFQLRLGIYLEISESRDFKPACPKLSDSGESCRRKFREPKSFGGVSLRSRLSEIS